MKTNTIITLLATSLFSPLAGVLLTMYYFSNTSGSISPEDLSRIFLPPLVGYIVSMVASAICIILALAPSVPEKDPMNAGRRYVGAILTWMNALNAFPLGLIAAFILQFRLHLWRRKA